MPDHPDRGRPVHVAFTGTIRSRWRDLDIDKISIALPGRGASWAVFDTAAVTITHLDGCLGPAGCPRPPFAVWTHSPSGRTTVLCKNHLDLWLDLVDGDPNGNEPHALGFLTGTGDGR